MSNQDWSHIGDDIMDAVQTAIEDGDFTNLSNVLNDSANLAMDKFEDALKGNPGNRNYRYRSDPGYNSSYSRTRRKTSYQYSRQGGSTSSYGGTDHYNNPVRTAYTNRFEQRTYTGPLAPFQKFRDRFLPPGRLSAPGYLEMILGGVFGGGCILSEMFLLLIMALLPFEPAMLVSFGIILPFTAAGIAVFMKGRKRLSLVKKFKKYVSCIDDKEYYPIKDLAAIAGVSKDQLLSDLRKMISMGWLRQGHLDAQNTNLILTNSAFRQYRETQNRYERQILEEKSKAVGHKFDGVGKDGVNLSNQAANAYKTGSASAASDPLAHLPEDVRNVIREGREYLRKIKASNEAIPGEEISNKISRLEDITDQIFDRVEQHPELVDDLRRFMKYYLPTTVKLLNAYEELDHQPAQGPNILKSKADIEETLDTINQAFENILDGFFATSAVDIASDISVMQTLMAQEGLLEDEISKRQEDALAEAETMIIDEDEEEELPLNRPDPIQEFLQSK